MRIIKKFQGEIPENKILNSKSNSQTDTYSCDYINEKTKYLNYKEQEQYFYIDGVNGNDENDGTQKHPFKTLDRFLDLLNYYSTDIRCHIITSGTYTISKTQICNAIIHIAGDVDGITINNGSNSEIVFYCGHLNLKNVVFDCIGLYFDNTITAFENVYFTNFFRIYGGQANFQNCKINCFRLYYGNAYFNNLTIDGKAKTNEALFFGPCAMGVFEGNFIIETLEADCNTFMSLYRGFYVFSPGTFTNNNSGGQYKYDTGLKTNYVNLMTTNTMKNNLNNVGTTTSESHMLTVTNNQNLPIG